MPFEGHKNKIYVLVIHTLPPNQKNVEAWKTWSTGQEYSDGKVKRKWNNTWKSSVNPLCNDSMLLENNDNQICNLSTPGKQEVKYAGYEIRG